MRSFDTLVRFVGHVDITRQPFGFPARVYEDVLIRANSEAEFYQKLNDIAGLLVSRQGMFALKNPPESIQPPDVSFDKRMYVPMSMLTHVDCVVKPITGETPRVEEDNKTVVGDGMGAEVKPN